MYHVSPPGICMLNIKVFAATAAWEQGFHWLGYIQWLPVLASHFPFQTPKQPNNLENQKVRNADLENWTVTSSLKNFWNEYQKWTTENSVHCDYLEEKFSDLTGMVPLQNRAKWKKKDGDAVHRQCRTPPPPLYWKTPKNFQAFERIYNTSITHWCHEHTIETHNLKKYLKPPSFEIN